MIKELKYTHEKIKEFARGFQKGYDTDLTPFIDTPEARKEVVMKYAILSGSIVIHDLRNGNWDSYNEDFFKAGCNEGIKYKAWGVILNTPSIFYDNFKDLSREKKNYIKINSSSEVPIEEQIIRLEGSSNLQRACIFLLYVNSNLIKSKNARQYGLLYDKTKSSNKNNELIYPEAKKIIDNSDGRLTPKDYADIKKVVCEKVLNELEKSKPLT